MKELDKSNELDEALALCLEVLRSRDGSDLETAEAMVEELREKAKMRGWGAKKVLWPLRLAVTGLTVGPDLTYLIMFWGSRGCADRIEASMTTLGRGK